MSPDDFLYDVAFSFLGEDEALAVQLNDLLKDRLVTFIYSDAKRQATLAGRDGEEAFSLVFGKQARTVVVLYRNGWGKRGFTSAEATANRNRAHESGYDFATFIPLDKPASSLHGSPKIAYGWGWKDGVWSTRQPSSNLACRKRVARPRS